MRAHLLKGRFLKQRVEPVARGHHSFLAALDELVLAPARANFVLTLAQVFENFRRNGHAATRWSDVGRRAAACSILAPAGGVGKRSGAGKRIPAGAPTRPHKPALLPPRRDRVVARDHFGFPSDAPGTTPPCPLSARARGAG
jgi:hypothetical protein